jgi:membrane-associated protease RseP (regulator of RpoE activity)
LLLLTVLCTLGAGAVLTGGYAPDIRPGFTGALISAGEFFVNAVERDWKVLLQGWSFALPLLGILLIHELGHYLAARRYAIDTTAPYFIPVPPTLSPIGSLGAFIRVRSPVVDRRQLLDVGAAGPLAGFVVAVGVLIWGYSTSERIPIVLGSDPSYITLMGQPLFLGESLLTRTFREWLIPGTTAVHLSLPAFAGWVGMFITGLNLIPLSQLDGGHVTYGILGRFQSRVALVAVLGLLWLAQRSPNWIVWVIFAFMVGGGRIGHPSVMVPHRSIPRSRWLVGLACVVVFVLTFVPIPFPE